MELITGNYFASQGMAEIDKVRSTSFRLVTPVRGPDSAGLGAVFVQVERMGGTLGLGWHSKGWGPAC